MSCQFNPQNRWEETLSRQALSCPCASHLLPGLLHTRPPSPPPAPRQALTQQQPVFSSKCKPEYATLCFNPSPAFPCFPICTNPWARRARVTWPCHATLPRSWGPEPSSDTPPRFLVGSCCTQHSVLARGLQILAEESPLVTHGGIK